MAVHVDGSLSMDGFFPDAIRLLRADLRRAFGSLDPKFSLFISERGPSAELRTLPLREDLRLPSDHLLRQTSRLDRALASAVENSPSGESVLVLITDNVQDEAATPTTIRKFIEGLNDERIVRISVVPMSLPFRGRVYFHKIGPGGSRGHYASLDECRRSIGRAVAFMSPRARIGEWGQNSTYYYAEYDGNRGVIAYYLLVRREGRKQAPVAPSLVAGLDTLQNTPRTDYTCLHVKPIDAGDITVRGMDVYKADGYAAWERQVNGASSLQTDAEFGRPSSEAYVHVGAARTPGEVDGVAGRPPARLLPVPGYWDNVIASEPFYFRFHYSLASVLEHIDIGGRTEGQDVSFSVPGARMSFLRRSRVHVDPSGASVLSDHRITPRLLQDGLTGSPGDGTLSSTETDLRPTTWYECRIWLRPVARLPGLMPYVWSLREDKREATLAFDVLMRIPPSAISLKQEFAERYFTESVARLDKIPMPAGVNIVQFLARDAIEVLLPLVMGR
jgi:hypothetical protein